MKLKNQGLIVCGTDTNIGKTVISSLLVQGLHATYWKPIQSGLEDGSDTSRVREILNLPEERCLPEAYKLNAAVSPHWAAEKENILISPDRLKIPVINNLLLIETAGGLMVPINRNLLQIDQIKYWGFPIVLVARSGLGTLNHTLLSLEALKSRGIPILGIFLNGVIHKDNPKTLEQFGDIPIIAQIPPFKELSSSELSKAWTNHNLKEKFKVFHKD